MYDDELGPIPLTNTTELEQAIKEALPSTNLPEIAE